jgi:hypothetical protein
MYVPVIKREHSAMNATDQPLADDLLHGAKEIGEFIGLSERQVFHHAERGHLPVTRIGRLLVGSKSRLRRHLAQEDETAA